MDYKQQIKEIVEFLYKETKSFATSSTYHIPYKKIQKEYNVWVGAQKAQFDIRDEFCTNYMNQIQSLDFDDIKQEVIIMIWESNKKKKYTIDNYEEFSKNALIMPPVEQFDDGSIDEEEWYRQHNIHIVVGNHDIELDYSADNVNEIDYALREMYEVEKDIKYATTGNTVGSKYRDATWKDVLKADALSRFYDRPDLDLKGAIHASIQNFTRGRFTELMQELEKKTSLGDEIEVNFSKLDTRDLWKIFNMSDRKQAFKEMLCQKIEIEELVDKNGMSSDRVVITDYSMKFAGDVVGWHYGIDWDKDSADNQYYIQKYIKEMIE